MQLDTATPTTATPTYPRPCGHPSGPGGSPAPTRRSGRGGVIAVALGLLALLMLAVGGLFLIRGTSSVSVGAESPVASSRSTNTGAASGSATSTDDVTPDAPATGAGSPASTAAPNAAPAPAPAVSPAPKPPAGPAPAITSFSTPDSIDCHNDDSPNFSASWTTTNAVKTTISIDGALYQSYGPNADVSLPFTCERAHTYVLTATNAGGASITKAITLQPRNVRPPQSDMDE